MLRLALPLLSQDPSNPVYGVSEGCAAFGCFPTLAAFKPRRKGTALVSTPALLLGLLGTVALTSLVLTSSLLSYTSTPDPITAETSTQTLPNPSAFDPLPLNSSAAHSTLATAHRVLSASAIARPQAALMASLRPVSKVVQGQKMMEGAGVQICRTVGTPLLRNLDPYLLLDELKLPADQATAGFPDHPHRGFETCSIMLSGKMEHKDSVGNHGVIGPGGVQWMTAGRGIVHSEMPKVTDGELWGFQLWINLPAKDKMVKPRYQDYQKEDIPVAEAEGVTVRVMAGQSHGVSGPINMRNPGMLLDVQVAQGGKFTQEVPEGWNGFCYVYGGSGAISGTKASREQALVLGPGDHIEATSDNAKAGLKFLLIAGKPIGEPIKQYGPFVMNTQAEIQQAFEDFQSGRLQNPNDNVWEA